MTPLHFACILGKSDIVKLLIEHKVNPNAVDKGFKLPINYAIESEGEQFRVIEFDLREIKAIVDWRKDLEGPSMMEQLMG